MNEIISYEKYAYTKNVIYQLYPVLEKLDSSQLEEIFSTFGRLETVAYNTYLFPYDVDLSNDLKTIEQANLLSVGLQEKYNISDKLLSQKYMEYKLYEFDRLLSEDELFDLVSLEKYHYQDRNNKKTM